MENVNPIGELMQATMDNVKNMLKVDTVVGDPIYTPDGITLIPICSILSISGEIGSWPFALYISLCSSEIASLLTIT